MFHRYKNYRRKCRTLKGVTPAMADTLATEAWTVSESLRRISIHSPGQRQ